MRDKLIANDPSCNQWYAKQDTRYDAIKHRNAKNDALIILNLVSYLISLINILNCDFNDIDKILC